MVYCEKCGKPIPDDSLFCPSCGAPVAQKSQGTYAASVQPDLRLAHWGERFLAWLVDVIIINIALIVLSRMVYFDPFFLTNSNWLPFWGWIPFVSIGGTSIASFLYWTITESTNHGRSIGKAFMHIRVVRTDGKPADFGQVAISSIGKSFLLFLDFVIGLFIYPRKKQRVFNHLSQTIVIREHRQ